MPICTRYPDHVYPEHNETCPWCAMAAMARAAFVSGPWDGILMTDQSGNGEARPIGLPPGVWSPVPSGGNPILPVVLLIDVSAAMANSVADLERGFRGFLQNVQSDSLLRNRADIAVVTFDFDAAVRLPFQTARSMLPLSFLTGDTSNMAAGIHLALNVLDARKAQYRAASLEYFRPGLFVVAAGQPDTSGLQEALQRLHEVEARKQVMVFGVAVNEQTVTPILSGLSHRNAPLSLNGAGTLTPLYGALSSLAVVNSATPDSIDLSESVEDPQRRTSVPRPPGWAEL